ncbi:unnamed protein product, partial [Didymodactylos carnosus]
MYVPGHDQHKLAKILTLQTKSDCIIIDCEDAVTDLMKDTARKNTRQFLRENYSKLQQREICLRINSVQSKYIQADIDYLLNEPVDCLFLPKVENVDDIKWLADTMKKRNVTPMNLAIYCESARSLFNLRDILTEAHKYENLLSPQAVVFGSDDFSGNLFLSSADVGIERTRDASELLYARQKLVTTCKLYKIQAIDMVYIDYNDLDGLKEQSLQGARMGFTGKQVIHPKQVPIVQNGTVLISQNFSSSRYLLKSSGGS